MTAVYSKVARFYTNYFLLQKLHYLLTDLSATESYWIRLFSMIYWLILEKDQVTGNSCNQRIWKVYSTDSGRFHWMSHYLVALGHNVDGSFADVEAEIKQQFFVVDRVCVCVCMWVCVCMCVLMWWLKHVCIHMCDSKREREGGRERDV